MEIAFCRQTPAVWAGLHCFFPAVEASHHVAGRLTVQVGQSYFVFCGGVGQILFEPGIFTYCRGVVTLPALRLSRALVPEIPVILLEGDVLDGTAVQPGLYQSDSGRTRGGIVTVGECRAAYRETARGILVENETEASVLEFRCVGAIHKRRDLPGISYLHALFRVDRARRNVYPVTQLVIRVQPESRTAVEAWQGFFFLVLAGQDAHRCGQYKQAVFYCNLHIIHLNQLTHILQIC